MKPFNYVKIKQRLWVKSIKRHTANRIYRKGHVSRTLYRSVW